jgi:thiamine-phosphate diphosphorylase
MKYCLITDRTRFKQSLSEVAMQAEVAGIDYFQLREKDLHGRDLLLLAKSLRAILRKTRLIVNGSLDVALACGADGVHLQKQNVPVSAVREAFPDLEIGYSAHSLQEMTTAANSGASYVFISPIFDPISKESVSPALGPRLGALWASSVNIPVFALGGISKENQSEIANGNFAGIAGISFFIREGIFSAEGLEA